MSKKNESYMSKKDKKKSKLSHTSSNTGGISNSNGIGAGGSALQLNNQHISKGNAATLPISYTFPVDQIVSFCPESLLFTNLLEFEKRLDSAITKRLVDVQEQQQRTRNTKIYKNLRLSIYNTYANQSAFYHLDNKSLVSVQEKPSWTLRIEGRLLDDGILQPQYNSTTPNKSGYPQLQQQQQQQLNPNIKRKKFTSFFKKVFIQIGHRDSCEWDKSQALLETDGFEVKRNGHQEIDVKIMMYLDYAPQKYKVLGNLSSLLNIHTDTKPKIISAFWNYIKINRLLDIDTKKINCDENLKNIFGLDVLQFNQIPQVLREHLGSPDPLEFNYTIRLTGEQKDHEQAYDINVEVDDTSHSIINNPAAKSQIQALDDEINKCVQSINIHKRKREFMSKLADNPLEFLHNQTNNLIKDYQVLKSNSPSGFEEERHSSFYYQPLMDEVVGKYLSKQSTPSPQTYVLPPSTPQTPSQSS